MPHFLLSFLLPRTDIHATKDDISANPLEEEEKEGKEGEEERKKKGGRQRSRWLEERKKDVGKTTGALYFSSFFTLLSRGRFVCGFRGTAFIFRKVTERYFFIGRAEETARRL